jgi:hypothetical protein
MRLELLAILSDIATVGAVVEKVDDELRFGLP